MPAIAMVGIAAGSALLNWWGNKKKKESVYDAEKATWDAAEREAYMRRQALTEVLKQSGLAGKYNLNDAVLSQIVGQVRPYTGAKPGAGQYADLAQGLLGALSYYQPSMGKASSSPASAPYYLAGVGQGYAPNTGGPNLGGWSLGGASGFRMCPGGGLSDWSGNCP